MSKTFSLPDYIEQELAKLNKEAEQNLAELAAEQTQLSAKLNMSLTEVLRSKMS